MDSASCQAEAVVEPALVDDRDWFVRAGNGNSFAKRKVNVLSYKCGE